MWLNVINIHLKYIFIIFFYKNRGYSEITSTDSNDSKKQSLAIKRLCNTHFHEPHQEHIPEPTPVGFLIFFSSRLLHEIFQLE